MPIIPALRRLRQEDHEFDTLSQNKQQEETRIMTTEVRT
jgi:hypothetical protein